MELVSVRTEAGSPGRARLVGTVAYDDRARCPEDYWFEVPEGHAGALSRTGNPWLACLAPLAATLGQRLKLSLPVDRLLLRNVREAVAIWRSWYPWLKPVEVVAEAGDEWPGQAGEKSASTFSGGVDSFFTALRSMEPGSLHVDDLLHVAGFDISLDNTAAYERRRERMAAAASDLGKSLVDVYTNLRQTRLEKAGWGSLWHGAGLASVGLALEGRYRRVLIASTHPYVDIHPLGSHPMTDPLFSTSRTRILHDGASYSRAEKTEHVVRFEVALRNLHVCFRAGSDWNCGSCEKCLRTMATLDLLGALSSAGTFAKKRCDPELLGRAFVRTKTQEGYYRAIRALAVARGRTEIVRAIDRALRRSRWRRQALRFPEWLSTRRGLWRTARPFRQALLAGERV